jgi:L-aminopeptidase/D-esterase-like protein
LLTLRDRQLTPLFQAVVEATEEAILNAIIGEETMVGRDGNTIPGLPVDLLMEIIRPRVNRR